jgi:hypothetical protein
MEAVAAAGWTGAADIIIIIISMVLWMEGVWISRRRRSGSGVGSVRDVPRKTTVGTVPLVGMKRVTKYVK